jgi:hypothetical protein
MEIVVLAAVGVLLAYLVARDGLWSRRNKAEQLAIVRSLQAANERAIADLERAGVCAHCGRGDA